MMFHFDAVLDKRVERILSQMTLKEKVSLLSGQDSWHTVAIPRLGIPSVVVTDGPHGVRTSKNDKGRTHGPATWFPTCTPGFTVTMCAWFSGSTVAIW